MCAFTGQSAAAGEALVFGLKNPTRASSEAAGHLAPFGNDGDSGTFWQAADAQPGAWWEVDLERLVAISEVSLDVSRGRQLSLPRRGVDRRRHLGHGR